MQYHDGSIGTTLDPPLFWRYSTVNGNFLPIIMTALLTCSLQMSPEDFLFEDRANEDEE